MHIDVIDTFPALEKINPQWIAVYDADPEAQYFLSWTWMWSWLNAVKGRWCVLGAKLSESSVEYVAFLPLRLRASADNSGRTSYEVTMAGNALADYTGILCRPNHQRQAIRAIAKHLRGLPWSSLNLEYMRMSGERYHSFLSSFPKRDFEFHDFDKSKINGDVDNCICPYINLPPDWNTYLNEHLSKNTKQKARRFLRKLDNNSSFHITHTNSDTLDRDIDILFRFWMRKWRAKKGNRADGIRNNIEMMLRNCAEYGELFMPVLWNDDVPLGALAILVDDNKKALMFLVSGCDTTMNNPPPGFLLHTYSIRYAIALEFATYDFLRGNELYKYSFGAEDRRIRCLLLRAKKEHKIRQVMQPRPRRNPIESGAHQRPFDEPRLPGLPAGLDLPLGGMRRDPALLGVARVMGGSE